MERITIAKEENSKPTVYYFLYMEFKGQPMDEMRAEFDELPNFEIASNKAMFLSRKENKVVIMHEANKKEYHYYDDRRECQKVCLNCHHWRDKSWTLKGWGVCDNPRNETKIGGLPLIRQYLLPNEKAAEELKSELEDSIRYPEDFGCILFEPQSIK